MVLDSPTFELLGCELGPINPGCGSARREIKDCMTFVVKSIHSRYPVEHRDGVFIRATFCLTYCPVNIKAIPQARSFRGLLAVDRSINSLENLTNLLDREK